MLPRQWFIVPDLDGPITGGTLYNRGLCGALAQSGADVAAVSLEQGRACLRSGEAGIHWVDSLYLEAMPELLGDRCAGQTVGLVAHYLPSLLTRGDTLTASELSSSEAFALEHAEVLLTPSPFMAGVLERLATGRRPVLVIEPGRSATQPAGKLGRGGNRGHLTALVVANLTPNKGVAPFLDALADAMADDDALSVDVVGSTHVDPACALECARACERPALRGRVSLLGGRSAAETFERMAESDLLISASRMESYGMALAEARGLGVPIVARRGGNVASHVRTDAGGELVSDDRALARACLELCRDPLELARRRERAQRHALPPRSWAEAARELVAQLRAATTACGA